MSESLPPACADCQKLLALGPDAFEQPGVRDHLANCATCSRLYSQYCEIDTLLNHVPDLKPLPDLTLRFQQIPQARQIADLKGSFAAWEGIVEEKPASHLSRSWLNELATHSFSQNQGKKTMQKPSLTPDTESSHALRHGQFQPPVNPAPRPRRSPWGAIASVAVLLVVLMTIFAWLLLPRLTQPGATASHGGATPTTVPATPTSSSTQQYAFTAQDSGKTVTYPITTRFTLTLNQQQYPHQNLQLACHPQGALGIITSGASASPPLYLVQYQAIAPGTCTIQNGDFALTVIVTGIAATPTATPTASSIVVSVGQVASHQAVGSKLTVLTTVNGFTLYVHEWQGASGFTCDGSCASTWKPLVYRGTGTPASTTPLPGKLSVGTDAQGRRVVFYQGYPLYTYVGDTKPGDFNAPSADNSPWQPAVPGIPTGL